jgi:hypothetical protein
MNGTIEAWRDNQRPDRICYVVKAGGKTRRLWTAETTELGKFLAANI